MKKLLLFIVLLPTFLLAQPGLGLDSLTTGILPPPPDSINLELPPLTPPPCPWVNNNFPEVTHFDGQNSPLIVPVLESQPWSFQIGSTPSSNTGPLTDVSGTGTYVFTEASGQQPDTWYAFQTECFNVDNNPGMEL